MTVTPKPGVAYIWDPADSSGPLTVRFTSASKHPFTVQGTPGPQSWWSLGLGMDVAVNDQLTVYLQGLGQLTSGSTESLSYGGGFCWRL